MPRQDPRFNGIDVIRLVENNLGPADKRLVFAWFFSLIPIKEPKVDVINLLLNLVSVIPVAGTFASIFQVTLATAQVAVDIAELFQFEFEEEDVELARTKLELASLREEFDDQRQELLRCQIALDNANERAEALLATQGLLEDELRDIKQEEASNVRVILDAVGTIRRFASDIRELARGISDRRESIFIRNSVDVIERETDIIEGAV